MRKTAILLLVIFFANIQLVFAQSKLDAIPFFGNIPFTQEEDFYSLDFGKMGKFNFTGSVKPLSLTATVGMDDLKTFPGAKVMSALGLQDIEMTVEKKGLGITANFDDKFKDDIVDEVRKIKLLAPVVGAIMNTLEIRESRAALFFNTSGELEGLLDINIYVLGKRLPIPEIKGKIDVAAIVKQIVGKIKDEGMGKIAEIGKVIKDAGKLASSAFGSSVSLVNKYATLGNTKRKHLHLTDGGEKYCRKHCIPNRAKYLVDNIMPKTEKSLNDFKDNIIDDLALIEGETYEETKRLRDEVFLKEWNNLNAKIEADWEEIRNDKEYIGYFVEQKWAENGGRQFRENIDRRKSSYYHTRDRIYRQLINKRLISKRGKTARIQSAANNTLINIEKGIVESTNAGPAWFSAQWEMERVSGTDYITLRNRWKRTLLNIESGKLESTRVKSTAWSAQWQLEKVKGINTVRIKNRWKNTYLNIKNGKLECSAITPNQKSALWKINTPYFVSKISNVNGEKKYNKDKGTILVSDNRKFSLGFTGFFVIASYAPYAAWMEGALDATELKFQKDGNLVVLKGSQVLFSSNSGNKGGQTLKLTDEGRLVILDKNNKEIWSNNFHEVRYNRKKGCGTFLRNGKVLKEHCGWSKNWHTILKIGTINNNINEEKVLFYDKNAGAADIYRVDANGNMHLLKNYTGFRKTWSRISWIPTNEHDGVIKFEEANGHWEKLKCDDNGNLSGHSKKQ